MELVKVVARGTPYELGLSHGRQVADRIRKSFNFRMGRIRAKSGETEAQVIRRSGVFRPPVEEHLPFLLPEIAGIAEGSGLSKDQVFFLQVATAVEDSAPSEGCSSGGFMTGPSQPTLVQNWDHWNAGRGLQILLQLEPNDAPSCLMFTHPGVVGYMGLNSEGVGHVGNGLWVEHQRLSGLTEYFVNRLILCQSSSSAAVKLLGTIEMASTKNYIIGDASGDLWDLELGDGKINARHMDAGFVVHTNHYCLNEDFQVFDRYERRMPDSRPRLERLQALLTPNSDEDQILEAFKDHSGFPTSLCRHEDGPERHTTTASVIMRLRSREMSIAYGPPCETPRQVHTVPTHAARR